MSHTADLHLLPGPIRPPRAARPLRKVLLTGATGFLGVYLVDQWLRQTEATIHCLVRAPDPDAGFARLAENMRRFDLPAPPRARLVIEPGTLEAPRCGLAEPRWATLADGLDAILHSGAVLHFVKRYRALRPANVDSTRTLLRLAADSGADFALISSVVAVSPRDPPERMLETDPPPAFDRIEGGYAQSKWVAERLTEQAAAEGIATRILRVGVVIGDAPRGLISEEQLQQRVATASAAAGIVLAPRCPIDLVPIEYVAAAAIAILRANPPAQGAFHLVNPAPITAELVEAAVPHIHRDWCVLPVAEWLARMRALAAQDGNHPLGPLLRGHPLTAGIRELEQQVPIYDCARTLAALAGTGIACPPSDTRLLARLLAPRSPAPAARQEEAAISPA